MSPLLEVSGLSVSFPFKTGLLGLKRGAVKAVDDVSFQIGFGEVLGLVGDSGCGKTTLSKAVLGLVKPDSGAIMLNGGNIIGDARDAKLRRRKIQAVFQDPFSSLNPRMTVLDIVTDAAVVHGIIRASERREAAVRLLSYVGLPEDTAGRYPHSFSGGQRQRICIARALSLNPDLLICDEPVSALDVSVQAQVLNLLMDLRKEKNLAMLFISHNMDVVRHISDRVAVMKAGRLSGISGNSI